jgi:hypothetical protein
MSDTTSVADEREATFRHWRLTAGISAPNTWTPTTALYASWEAFAGGPPGSMGWFAAQMRAAGIQTFRTNQAKGFRFRLADVDEIKNEIKNGITAATAARERARRDSDAEALAAAVRAQKDAQQRAGALLETHQAAPDDFGISEFVARRWCSLVQLDAKQFDAKVADSAGRAIAAMQNGGETSPNLRTIISPWVRDADGNLSRTISTPGEIPILKGERFQENSRSETSTISAQRSQAVRREV